MKHYKIGDSYSSSNEIVFHHKLPIDMIQEIIVAPERYEAVSQMLHKAQKNIPLKILNKAPNISERIEQ